MDPLPIHGSRALLLLCFALAMLSRAATGVSQQPNIVFLVSDDAGYADFGAQVNPATGQPYAPDFADLTPHIDSITNRGVRFTRGYVTGAAYDHAVVSLDIFATSAAVAELTVPADRTLDGTNLMPYLTRENNGRPHPQLFWRVGDRAAFREQDWKAVRMSDSRWELYNLADDITESRNLAASHSQQLERLALQWSQLNQEMAQPTF